MRVKKIDQISECERFPATDDSAPRKSKWTPEQSKAREGSDERGEKDKEKERQKYRKGER